jgi:hypothetical protein
MPKLAMPFDLSPQQTLDSPVPGELAVSLMTPGIGQGNVEDGEAVMMLI